MADTYEKDLGQKTSLTTSDFIRVVGSDNVSYKQVMSNVMDIMGVIRRDLTTSITAYADTLDAGRIHLIRIATTDVATVDVPSGYQYSGGVIYRETNGESVIVLFRANADGVAIRRKYSGTWASWVIQPTRAEVDALNSTTDITITPTTNSNYTLAPQTPHLKRGNVVTFGLLISQQTASSSYVEIGSFPADCAPTAWCYYSTNPDRDNSILAINSSGKIMIKGDLGTQKYFTITYTR